MFPPPPILCFLLLLPPHCKKCYCMIVRISAFDNDTHDVINCFAGFRAFYWDFTCIEYKGNYNQTSSLLRCYDNPNDKPFFLKTFCRFLYTNKCKRILIHKLSSEYMEIKVCRIVFLTRYIKRPYNTIICDMATMH